MFRTKSLWILTGIALICSISYVWEEGQGSCLFPSGGRASNER